MRIDARRARGRGSSLLWRGRRRGFGGGRASGSGRSERESVRLKGFCRCVSGETYPKDHAGWEDDAEREDLDHYVDP